MMLAYLKEHGRDAGIGLLASLPLGLALFGPLWLAWMYLWPHGQGNTCAGMMAGLEVFIAWPFVWAAVSVGLTWMAVRQGWRAAVYLAAVLTALAGIVDYFVFVGKIG